MDVRRGYPGRGELQSVAVPLGPAYKSLGISSLGNYFEVPVKKSLAKNSLCDTK